MLEKSYTSNRLQPGTIVEFFHNNALQIGCILVQKNTNYNIYTITKRQIQLPVARILPWIGPFYAEQLSHAIVLEHLIQHNEKRKKILQEIDVTVLWDSLIDDISVITADEGATFLTQAPEIDFIAAFARGMLQEKNFFSFKYPYFHLYSREQHAVLLRAEEQRQGIESAKEYCLALWNKYVYGVSIPENIQTNVRELVHAVLLQRVFNPQDAATQNEWEQYIGKIPEHETLPLVLGVAAGIFPEHYNPFFMRNGFTVDDTTRQIQFPPYTSTSIQYGASPSIAILTCDTHSTLAQDFYNNVTDNSTPIPYVAIDAPSTKDVDDAIYVVKNDTGYTVHFAIAIPILAFDLSGELCDHIAKRGASIYLPEGVHHMLPECIATQGYSLSCHKKQPMLTGTISLQKDLAICATKLSLQYAAISENITYATCEGYLKQCSATLPKQYHWLQDAYSLAMALQEKRLVSGGICIQRAEPMIRIRSASDITPDDPFIVHIEEDMGYTCSTQLVSELMILINNALALYAREHAIPYLYRVQNTTLPATMKVEERIVTNPVAIQSIVKHLCSSFCSITPQKHAALGLFVYGTVTSPLRRYIDFINEVQLVTTLCNTIPYYTEKNLEEKLSQIQKVSSNVSKIQRERTLYWKLVYLEERKKHAQKQKENFIIEIILLDAHTIYIPSIALTIATTFTNTMQRSGIGSTLSVVVQSVNPYCNTILVCDI